MAQGTDPSKRLSFRDWRLWALTATLSLLGGTYAWHLNRLEASRESQKLRSLVEKLAYRRPPGFTPQQWESAVAFTMNLHAKSLTHLTDASSLHEVREELERKMDLKVDLETIEWIWDSYAKLSHAGDNYQHFRRRMHEEIESGGGNWGIKVP